MKFPFSLKQRSSTVTGLVLLSLLAWWVCRSRAGRGLLPLLPLSESDAMLLREPQKLFLLETNPSASALGPRVACTVESAASRANLSAVVVALASTHLDLGDEVTRTIYERFGGEKVHFRRIVPDLDFEGTPLHAMWTNGTFHEKSDYFVVHLSDALRLALVYKYGGWYADTDTLFLGPLSSLGAENVLAATAKSEERERNGHYHLTNYIFGMAAKGHSLLEKCMHIFARDFVGTHRSQVGPWALTNAFMHLCGVEGAFNRIWFQGIPDTSKTCLFLTVVGPDTFHPFRPYQSSELWAAEGSEVSSEEWERRVGGALAVHFYNVGSGKRNVSGDPKKDAYSYFAPKYCPITYRTAQENF